jgi:outer membrane protein assembly factor BamB
MLAIELAQAGDLSPPKIRWRHRSSGPCAPSGVIYHERLYVVTSDGVVSCLALDDGRTLWRQQLAGPVSASLVAGAGHVYVTAESGEVCVLRASDTYELVATSAMHELCLATPAIADSEIFLRTESHLFCISDKATSGADAPQPEIAADLSPDTLSPSDLPAE